MKRIYYIATALLMVAVVACTKDNGTVDFKLDRDVIAVEAIGGTQTVQLSSADAWVASTDEPWITVSPANGRGSTPCRFVIDSALSATPRRGVVRIENQATFEQREVVIEQQGFP